MKQLIYAGAYNQQGEQGITAYGFDEHTGRLYRLLRGGGDADNPSFAAVDGDFLYAANELPGQARVKSYQIDRKSGSLFLLDSMEFKGANMCHITLWPGKRYLSCANYSSGSFVVIPVEKGKLLQPVCLEQHHGVGVLCTTRQEAPHIHSTCVSPEGRYLLAADLGLDWVRVMEIDVQTGRMNQAPKCVQIYTPGGEGPRHMVFGRDGKYLYLITELANHCLVYGWDEETGNSELVQTVDLLPEGFSGESKAADIHLSPDGNYLYCSNRGADTISVFSVTDNDGTLIPVQNVTSHGEFPRSFAVLEHYILIAARHGNSIIACCRDSKSGLIGPVTDTVALNQAVFVLPAGPLEGEAE